MSKYRHLTDAEFLSLISESRSHSPVIESLCLRLEEAISTKEQPPASDKAECPVCEATLQVDFDTENEIYNLKSGV